MMKYFFQGDESTIVIRTDNSDNEIILIITYFFYKKSQVPSHFLRDLYIDIKLQDFSKNYAKMIKSCIRSIVQTNVAVKKVLKENFGILVRDSPNSTSLEIPVHEATTLLMDQYDYNLQL